MKYKKSGRVMTLLLSAVLTLCLLPLPVRAAGAETAVQLGDYIRLGSYDGEPIFVALRQRGRKRPADALRQGTVRLYAL